MVMGTIIEGDVEGDVLLEGGVGELLREIVLLGGWDGGLLLGLET